jgi:branched-chain amino acid transport system ATP-binding protein
MTTAALQVESIDTFYSKSHILHGISLHVDSGELVVVLGRNGAGKTTTLRSIMGLTPPRQGRITILGRDVTHKAPHAIASLGVGYVPEGRHIFPNLTVGENLATTAGKRSGTYTIEGMYELFPILSKRKGQTGLHLSGGEQEMLAIARALLLNPKLLVLDEPSQGLAPIIVQEVFQTLKRLKAEGVSTLLAEQNARMALQIAVRAYVLDDGKVVYEGDAEELRSDEDRIRKLAGAKATK